ncbi:sensor histidine kinase [Paenibacillus flagellatus]|uniref:histidine kinase n=1 Tax=Paenibacillus flagellatus TaxID=2211139 RepID=A0A2V5KIL5_9BACL|nr:ATP-binding protein [Paenibacillus flagellatus]PYI54330.1 sensor histidine kinase [Paenibacillus flagellatus]
MSDRIRILIVIMAATALLGEVKLNPFGDTFRISLGIVVYFFGLLWFSVPVLSTGLLTGGAVVLFRVGMDLAGGDAGLFESFMRHSSTFGFYLCFAVAVKLMRIRKQAEFPIRVGLIGAAADFTSNVAELTGRYLLLDGAPPTWHGILLVAMAGVLRSFFVVGLYNMLSIRQVRQEAEWRKLELDRMMLLNSSLYEESFFLRKLMAQVEMLTRESYRLYRRLMEQRVAEHRAALHMAENVHELKKDMQRIMAGLSKLMRPNEAGERLPIPELCGLAVRANEKYADSLGKRIAFRVEAGVQLSTNQVYALLSILNNLLANAVEAIAEEGEVVVEAELVDDWVRFQVRDDGPGISNPEREWVFEPGYTTKFDSEGYSSTGIGLTHARDIAKSLGGALELREQAVGGARFELRVPVDQLMRKEEDEADEALSDR